MNPLGNEFLHKNFINFFPSKSQISRLFGGSPSPGGFLLSTLPSKSAALTLNLGTQYCVQISHLHVPYQHPSVQYEVMSCPWILFMGRTVSHARQKMRLCSRLTGKRKIIPLFLISISCCIPNQELVLSLQDALRMALASEPMEQPWQSVVTRG